jgi:hypothetical protein
MTPTTPNDNNSQPQDVRVDGPAGDDGATLVSGGLSPEDHNTPSNTSEDAWQGHRVDDANTIPQEDYYGNVPGETTALTRLAPSINLGDWISVDALLNDFPYTQTGVAERLVSRQKQKIRYCHTWETMARLEWPALGAGYYELDSRAGNRGHTLYTSQRCPH